MKEGEQRGLPIDDQIKIFYIASVRKAAEYVEKRNEHDSQTDESFSRFFTDAFIQNKLVVMYGSALYENHMQEAVRDAGFQRPFGIALPTLSQDIKIILHPEMVFQADQDLIDAAEEQGVEVATDGPQVMMYILDSFIKHNQTPEDIAVNDFLFIPYMIQAHLTGKYPLGTGEKSEEFQKCVTEAFNLVRKFIRSLTPPQRIDFSQSIDWIGDMTDEELKRHAEKFCKYRVEAIKPPGLWEAPVSQEETPAEAVTNKIEYLHLTDRDLPKREAGKATPSGMWTEFGTNRWNTDHQLFGRYQALTDLQSIQVDFKLDSSFFPLGYGFFDTLEITAGPHYRIEQHAITGQETGSLVLLAGEYNFSEETTQLLHQLANDKGTKPEVAKALKTILRTV